MPAFCLVKWLARGGLWLSPFLWESPLPYHVCFLWTQDASK